MNLLIDYTFYNYNIDKMHYKCNKISLDLAIKSRI